MAGKSNKEMHPFMAELMTKLGCENLSEMSQKTGIPLQTLRQYGYENRYPAAWESARKLSEATNTTIDELLTRFAG